MTQYRIPSHIRTRRYLLRAWQVSDAPLLKQAIDESLPHLQPWMPWALNEPSSLESMNERVMKFQNQSANGDEWLFGIFTPDEAALLGACGLHRRIGPTGLEIGYWVHAAHTRKGIATESAAALTAVAFDLPHIERVEIKCDPRNFASAGVPKKLGYELVEILANDAHTPAGEPRDTMVWRITRSAWTNQVNA